MKGEVSPIARRRSRLRLVKRLLILRHAKSSWGDPALADFDRPLAPRGRRAAKSIRKHLELGAVEIDLVLCSPARRARETLARIEKALGNAMVELDETLYGAGSDPLLARLRKVPDGVGSVLLIGHNPGLHDLALRLAPDAARLHEGFPTAALATLEVDAASWGELGRAGSRLVDYVVPRELA
jgi:phosphohistidine phosphatase